MRRRARTSEDGCLFRFLICLLNENVPVGSCSWVEHAAR